MKTRRTVSRRELTILGTWSIAGMLIAGFPAQAMAKSKHAGKQDKEGCVAAYTKGKERANAAALREARELFARCAKSSCSAFLQQECGHLYTQTDADIPSVIPVVTDESGAPRALVEVKLDGALLTSRLDGHALQVDPGKHEISFSTDDGVFSTQKVMILQGQHNIPVKAQVPSGRRRMAAAAGDAKLRQAVFEAPAPAKSAETEEAAPARAAEPAGEVAQANDSSSESESTAPSESVASSPRHMTALSYVAGGVGLAGIGGYFLLNTWARKDNDKLGPCAEAGNLCMTSDLDHVKSLYLGANISGAIGLAAIATSAILYVRSSSSSEESASARTASLKHKRTASIRMLDVQARQSGALASIGGEF